MTALRGIRVLELAESVSGEYCGKLLADFGAEVIKIEKPGCGSPTRNLGPFIDDQPGTENSGLFAYLNTGKCSIELELNNSSGRRKLQALLAQIDAVIDDHCAEWLRNLGLDADSLQAQHPGLVVCSISNFGLNPPEDRRHAEDINVFHSSGWGYHTPTGATPIQPPLNGAGRFLPSYEAGIEAAMCMTAALYDRLERKTGRFIEISKQDVMASRADYVLAQMLAGDMNVGTERNAFDLAGPAGIFPCKDGFIYIWLSALAHWEGLRKLLENPQWMEEFPASWLERECTPARVAVCRQHIVEWLKTQRKHEAAEKAQKLGITLVAVNDARDLMASDQYQFREFFTELEHPILGTRRYPTVPYKMSVTPTRPTAPAPLLGQHNSNGLHAFTDKRTGEIK